MKLKGKGLKAERALKSIEEDVKHIMEKLKAAHQCISKTILDKNNISTGNSKKTEGGKNDSEKNSDQSALSDEVQERLIVSDRPERILFTKYGLRFYVDFLVVAHNENSNNDIVGAIIYGTQRSLCLETCLKNRTADNGMKGRPMIAVDPTSQTAM